jgi:hypothetical protein
MSPRRTVTLYGLAATLALSVSLRVAADAEEPTAASESGSSATGAFAGPGSLETRSARAQRIAIEYEAARTAWQAEYRSLLTDYRDARKRIVTAEDRWGQKRRKQRLRGEPRVKARAEIDEARQALADAMTALREFHERARTEGAEPGWLYQVEDEFPDIDSAVASP